MACEPLVPYLPGIFRTVNKDLVVQRLSSNAFLNEKIEQYFSNSVAKQPAKRFVLQLTVEMNGDPGRRVRAPHQGYRNPGQV